MKRLRLAFLLCLVFVLSIRAQNLTLQIYSGSTGQLQNSFQNWSWATVNLQDKTVVRPGSTYATSVVIQGYKAAYFHGDFFMPINSLPQISFWINGGTNGGQSVNVLVTSGGNAVGQAVSIDTLVGKPIPANQWVQVQASFSVFQSAQNVMLDGIQFQAGTNDDQGSVYLDDIEFIATMPSSVPVTVSVRNNMRQPVSPNIYGVNFATADQLKSLKYPVNRWGGNAVTRYNYLTDSSNRASDWYFEDIANDVPDVSKLPDGSQSYVFVKDAITNGAKVLLTIPTIGWRPFDRQKRCGFSVAKYGQQQGTDPYDADCGNGEKPDGTLLTANDPHDTSVESDPSFNVDWIKYLDKTFGVGTVRWFQLDNEPGLWHQTHRDVHPHPLTYDELWNRTLAYGGAVKSAFPDSVIFGPISWGWCAYMYSPADGCTDGTDRKAHGDLPLLQWFIQQITDYKKTSGKQVVDVIDIHFYPQAPNVFSNKEDVLTALLRLRSPRSLWDTTYASESWIGQPIYILKRINDWISSINPGGFKVAVSEYNFGDDSLISAALAEVEALSIFAQENVTIATRWICPATGSIAEDGFKLYLNYDGQGSKVTGDFIQAASSNSEVVTSFAYDDSKTRTIYVVIINKVSTAPVPVTIDISAIATSGQVKYFSFDKGEHIHASGTGMVMNGVVQYNAPAWSANLAVINY